MVKFAFLFLFIFLTSCLDFPFLFSQNAKPFSVEAGEGYHDENGNPYSGVIPKGALSEVHVSYQEDFGATPHLKSALMFYYVLLKGDAVFNPPFHSFEEFRAMAKSFIFETGKTHFNIPLVNEDPLKEKSQIMAKTENDHIGTVYSVYIIPDEPNYTKNYDFEHPIADIVAPKGVGGLQIPSWLLKSGKWFDRKDPSLFVSFSHHAKADELEINENTGILGIKDFFYIDGGFSPNYTFASMDTLSGGGAVSDYGVLPDNSGVYAKLEIVHSKHLGFGSSITFILNKGSNEIEILGYNAVLHQEEHGFMKNKNPKFDWTKIFPPRYRTASDYRFSFN